MVEIDDVAAQGWDAIQEAADKLYAGQEPKHYGTVVKWRIGGPDPLDGISVYESEKHGAHWHYVSFGFSELYEKESNDPEWSGFGFELTFRLKRDRDQAEPPMWPINLMQNLARYVFKSGNFFEAGHYLDCNGPIMSSANTALTGIIFVSDSEFGSIDSPNGKVNFLQMVAVTGDELKIAIQWETLKFAELLEKKVPLFITDLDRKSVMDDSNLKQQVNDGIARDGSKTSAVGVTQLDYEVPESADGQCEITIDALAIPDVVSILPTRTNHGRDLVLYDKESVVKFVPAEKYSFDEDDDGLVLNVTSDDVKQLIAILKPKEGVYEIIRFRVRVEKIPIRDQEGNVVEVVG